MITEEKIIVKVPTATPSAGNCRPIEFKMIYLPVDQNEKPFEKECYFQIEKNYIVYSNCFDTIFVMNLQTKKEQFIELKPKPYFEFKTIESSVNSIKIEQKELRFRYLIGTHENYNYTERKMKLKI